MTETYGFAAARARPSWKASGWCRATGRPTRCSSSCIRPRRCSCCRCRWRWPMPGCTFCARPAATRRTTAPLIMEKVVYDLGQYVRHAREALGLREGGAGRLVGRRFAVAVLPGAGRTSRPSPTRRPATRRPDRGGPAARRRRDLHRRAPEPRRDADRMARPVGDGRARSGQARSRARHLCAGRARTSRRSRRNSCALPRRADRAQPQDHELGAGALETLKKRDDGEIERAFVVHRTMCDVRWIDPAVDPNGRKPNWCYLGDPRTVNVGPVGLARYTYAALVALAVVATTCRTPRAAQRRARHAHARCCRS